jgi:hypothetical protein
VSPYHSRRRRSDRQVAVLEIVLVLLVLLAVAALVAYVIVNAGGGHNLT